MKPGTAAARLLGLLATDVCGDLVTATNDSEVRRQFARLMSLCVQIRDANESATDGAKGA